jgi:hypothetical protein
MGAAWMTVRVRGGGDTPSKPESLGGDDRDKEGEVTPPPHSPPRDALPLLGNIFSRQAWIAVSTHWLKWPQTEIGPSTSSLSQPYLIPASTDCCACVDKNNSPIWGFAGPTVLTGHRGCNRHDGGTILVGS